MRGPRSRRGLAPRCSRAGLSGRLLPDTSPAGPAPAAGRLRAARGGSSGGAVLESTAVPTAACQPGASKRFSFRPEGKFQPGHSEETCL